MPDLRPVSYILGLMVATLGATMLVPLGFDHADGHPEAGVFLKCAVVTMLAGGFVALASANGAGEGLTLRHSFLVTTGAWSVLPVFGALPFVFGSTALAPVDAFFESVSGFTTTGTTVIVGIDGLSRGMNLWRALTQWLGGLGIVVVALLFLPVMKVGGMQFFRSEGFDTLGKVLPRALDISSGLIQVYIWLTLACGMVYFLLGMTAFDALIHALTTVATGGFSNYDASFGTYQGAPEIAGGVFMVLATLPFIRYLQLLQGNPAPLWRDVQVRAYLRWTGYAVGVIALWLIAVNRQEPLPALREAFFNVTSTFSGTGYTSVDLSLWGAFPLVILLVVGVIGGCTSSTGCSIKVFRYLILIEAIRVRIRRLYSPSRVALMHYDGRRVDEDVLNSVIQLFTLFILTFGALTVGLGLAGLELRTAVTAAWTAVFNIGPAFGPEVGPTGAVDGFPEPAKWLMIAGMLLGRLELIAVIVLFTRRFWVQ